MTSIVARLREYLAATTGGEWSWTWTDEGEDAPDFWVEVNGEPIMRGGRDVHDAVLIANAITHLSALLDVVERFAAAGVMVMRTTNGRGIWFCAICGGASHAPDCPWLAARRLCGMDGEA